MMGVLYNVGTNTINYHLQKLYKDGEIDKDSVIRKFRITATDGKAYDTMHYNLKAIIAVGNKVDSPKAVQFRKWANTIIEEYTIKGYAMDDERLKKGGTILTKEYFEQLLERIREIRLSERKFYQKITDIYATSIDYDAVLKFKDKYLRKAFKKSTYNLTRFKKENPWSVNYAKYMVQRQMRQEDSLQLFRISSIMLSMVTLLQRLYITGQMQKRSIWDLHPGRAPLRARYTNMM